MTPNLSLLTLAAAAALLCVPPAAAQDRIFNYTYQSVILAPGDREIEVWNTIRWGHQDYFRAFNHRLEFEMGVAHNMQTAFYLNIQEATAILKEPGFELREDGTLAPATISVLARDAEVSFSNEWKVKLLDPAADAFGLALYGEYLIRSNGLELEPRLILDKLVGRTVLAFNASAEFELEEDVDEEGNEQTNRETSVELDFAGSTNLAAGLYLGGEAVLRTGFGAGAVTYSALFAGPTLSWAGEKFWINVTVLPQLVGLKGATRDGLVLGPLERLETRLLFSYAL